MHEPHTCTIVDITNCDICSDSHNSKISNMTKLELMEEMILFQKERSRMGYFTWPMIIRGQLLFKMIEESAETQEMKLLANSYLEYFNFEITNYEKLINPRNESEEPIENVIHIDFKNKKRIA